MGDYTAIRFTPIDRTWIAPPNFILEVAAILGASTFDHFTVNREDPALRDTDAAEVERYDEIIRKSNVAIEEAMREHRAGRGYMTHMMFRHGEFMKSLTLAVFTSLPVSLSNNYSPWDTSISNGHWEICSDYTGKRVDEGACSFSMSADGCPADPPLYLEKFLLVEDVVQFKRRLESLSSQPWTAVLDLT